MGRICDRAVEMSRNGKRVCVLTGASGRLGSMFCRLYGHRYEIVAVSNTQSVLPPPCMSWHVDPLEPDVRWRANGRGFVTIQADLTDRGQIPRVVDFALASFGRVDLVVNAAAIVRCAPLLSAETNIGDVARMLDLNAVVPLRLAVEVAKRFWHSRVAENAAMNRNVVNVSSTSGAYVFPGLGQAGYGASKAALNMLTCHMAEEFSELGIRVNSVAPDTFPERVTTESVCDAIARLDADSKTGRMLLLEPEGETVI
jgi:NAD(P)-dependent dehydrogenase (short-subunit alcohol dehydrogenase family)